METIKYNFICKDCGGSWGIFTDGRTATGTEIADLMAVHELNCTPTEQFKAKSNA